MTESRRSRRRSKTAAHSHPLSDLIGKVVRIPATMYGIDVPGMVYRAKVVKKDTSHKNAVVLSFFEDDGSQHWAPAEDVRKWLANPDLEGKCTGAESDKYAIETLLQFRELSQRGCATAEGQSSDEQTEPQSTNTRQEVPLDSDEMQINAANEKKCVWQTSRGAGALPNGKGKLDDLLGAIGGLDTLEEVRKDLSMTEKNS
ncbi:hypothetical protein BSKO_09387 [Bryopsis sp. KO-2023]|nr:hypothetical protein BSKO_09387 [Bryopsis sp. KO-2023]